MKVSAMDVSSELFELVRYDLSYDQQVLLDTVAMLAVHPWSDGVILTYSYARTLPHDGAARTILGCHVYARHNNDWEFCTSSGLALRGSGPLGDVISYAHGVNQRVIRQLIDVFGLAHTAEVNHVTAIFADQTTITCQIVHGVWALAAYSSAMLTTIIAYDARGTPLAVHEIDGGEREART